MSDDYFGEAREEGRAPQLKVKWPLRPANLIEGGLNGLMGDAMQLVQGRAPVIFIEDDEFKNANEYAAIYGTPLTVHEAIAMQGIVYGEVQEKFRRQLIVARELGESATMERYLIACEAEGIDPILKRKTT